MSKITSLTNLLPSSIPLTSQYVKIPHHPIGIRRIRRQHLNSFSNTFVAKRSTALPSRLQSNDSIPMRIKTRVCRALGIYTLKCPLGRANTSPVECFMAVDRVTCRDERGKAMMKSCGHVCSSQQSRGDRGRLEHGVSCKHGE